MKLHHHIIIIYAQANMQIREYRLLVSHLITKAGWNTTRSIFCCGGTALQLCFLENMFHCHPLTFWPPLFFFSKFSSIMWYVKIIWPHCDAKVLFFIFLLSNAIVLIVLLSVHEKHHHIHLYISYLFTFLWIHFSICNLFLFISFRAE